MLERVIEISCNVIIAHSPFHAAFALPPPSRIRTVRPMKERAMHRDRVIRGYLTEGLASYSRFGERDAYQMNFTCRFNF